MTMAEVKCAECGREIDTLQEGHFIEAETVYCEKCYANKRWGEVDADTRRAWREQILILVREALRIEDPDERREALKQLKRKVPGELEGEIPEESSP